MPIAAELLDEGEKDFDEVVKGEKEPAMPHGHGGMDGMM